MVIATCPLTGAALQQLRGRNGRHISFYHKHRDDRLDYKGIKRPHRPLPKQNDAIQSCVQGLQNHDRGRLIMACGTGKTFTALRILVPNEVFLSHSSQDRTLVERLADVLRANGVPIWYSDAGKMADQRAVGRDDRPGRL